MYFPGQDGYRAADLAHAAPLPHAGDLVDYLDERGVTHRYRVREVVHTLQVAPQFRAVRASEGPNGPMKARNPDPAEVAPEIPEGTATARRPPRSHPGGDFLGPPGRRPCFGRGSSSATSE